jgi:hypothetical protein
LGARESRSRGALSVALVVLASLMALGGGLTLYVREELVDSSAFAERAVDAVHEPTLQRVVAREIAVQVLEPAVPDLVAGRPFVQEAVRFVIGSEPFGNVIRTAALHGHRLLFERNGGNAVFDIADAGSAIAPALRTLAPSIADEIPKHAETVLLTIRKRSFAAHTLRIADAVRPLGFVLPALAVVLFALAIVIAPNRRVAITRSAIGVGVTGIALALTLELSRRYVVSHVFGTGELTNADVRGAVDELWGSYLDDLATWTLLLGGVAWMVAAGSSSVLAPYSSRARLAQLWALSRRQLPSRIRAARGAIVLIVGLLIIVKPTLALRIVAVLGGCLLVYVGTGELLSATAPPEARVRRPRAIGRRHVAAVGGVVAACAAAIGFAVALTGHASKAQARSRTCNGYAQLCSRRLDEVAFAGTHNSMSAADSPGWLIANQDRAVGQQLEDGIRLFKISTHYGVASAEGRVSTDIAAEGKRLNRVASKLTPAGREALQRFSRSLSHASPGSKRDIWLCHTLCELGATRMIDFLTLIRRFLEANLGQVIILFDEDYVSERDLNDVFARAGLSRRLATLQVGQPLPTLADLIGSHRNIVVFAQNHVSGRYSWNQPAFKWIQDTPLGATKPAQFTCKLSRGSAINPLLMMNNWADIFPPRPAPNVPVVQEAFILKRARDCVEQRGRAPNFILTDYYNRGGVVDAVATLNGVGGQRPAATTPVG